MRNQILHEIKISLMVAGIGAGLFASFLFFGMRAKACEIRDGVHTPIRAELVTMDREELTDMRGATQPIGQADLDLMAAIIYAEAGDQDMTGMRLVGDCICNRMRSEQFPDTLAGVVFQPGQFAPVTDGGLDRAWGNVTPECYEAAELALSGDHIDTQVLYFSMYGCANGVFAYQHGCHYFGY